MTAITDEKIKVINKWDGLTVKNTLDDVVKKVLAVCSLSYFFFMGILQLYQWYVEKTCIYQATESDGHKKRIWKWSSELKTYDDKYVLSAEFVREGHSSMGLVSKSIGCYIDQDGEILVPTLKKEIEDLFNRVTKEE